MAALSSVAAYLSSRIWSSPVPTVELTLDQKLDKVRKGEWIVANAGLIRHADHVFNLRGDIPGSMVLPDGVREQILHAAHAREETCGGQKRFHLGNDFNFKHEKMHKPRELAILYRVLNAYRLKEEADYAAARVTQPTLERSILVEKHVFEMEEYFLNLNGHATWSSQDALDDFRRQLVLELEALSDGHLSPIISKLKSGNSPTIIFRICDIAYGFVAINGVGSSMPAESDMLAKNIKELKGHVLCKILQDLDREEESVLAGPREQRVEGSKKKKVATVALNAIVMSTENLAEAAGVNVIIPIRFFSRIIPGTVEEIPASMCKEVAQARIERLHIKVYTHLEPEIFRLMNLPPHPENAQQLDQLKVASRTFRQLIAYYDDILPYVYR